MKNFNIELNNFDFNFHNFVNLVETNTPENNDFLINITKDTVTCTMLTLR